MTLVYDEPTIPVLFAIFEALILRRKGRHLGTVFVSLPAVCDTVATNLPQSPGMNI